jgi:hypothetical protein
MSYARPDRPVVGDQRVQQWLKRQEDRGKDQPDVANFLAKQLGRGRGLSSQVANKYSDGKYPTGSYGSLGRFDAFLGADEDFDKKYGRGSAANLRGLQGVELGKGDVYMGATPIETPRFSTRTVDGGESSTPASTRYDITVLPRWMVKQAGSTAGGSAAANAAASQSPSDLEPPKDLLAAREAFDRANAYQAQGSSASLPDLSKVGGDLFNSIQGAAQDQIDDYERRFLPSLYANANLTAKEIAYETQNAIAGLPDNLALPDYNNVFPAGANKKGGLYKWLERRIK